MTTDVGKGISLEELIERIGDDAQVIIVKDQNSDITFQDAGLDVWRYIVEGCFLYKSDKTAEIDPRSIDFGRGSDGSAYIIAPEHKIAKKIVEDLKEKYPGELSCEIVDKAALIEMKANKPPEELHLPSLD
ncbi:MAG: hypothetical protein KAJ29_04035 [Alphaproteobacteria bacterium]|nr:hypothetical protein [Alphaproteobacteria bacterium]